MEAERTIPLNTSSDIIVLLKIDMASAVIDRITVFNGNQPNWGELDMCYRTVRKWLEVR
jgi:hypothetical protein